MRLEQRIGRAHRLGQTRDVHIYNLVTEHTIEEHIMYLLHKKINMFQEIIANSMRSCPPQARQKL